MAATYQVFPFVPAGAVAYARAWAQARNPQYGDFSDMGGDCSNFISQTLVAGGAVMNETRGVGWYYHSMNDRAPAWTGVPFLWRFLATNKGRGPFGHEILPEEARPGDIIQLKFAHMPDFSHSLLVQKAGTPPTPENIRVAAHSIDADERPLRTYSYVAARVMRIDGVRK
ncbi:MAG: amidase domain-containing protein [Oscillospiraceae bacterium]|jgi:hypothetical protein|nr:amidase domain-containing protein [Oscillospiraceae bacterium]